MEDEKKSGLPISSGDLVSLLPLCCAFGVPEFFLGAVRRLPGPQFPHRLLSARVGSTTTHPSLTQHNSTSTHMNKHIVYNTAYQVLCPSTPFL